ncbi:MAG TPA: aryl-sulfate sulfotransferase, partial [Ilumatobacteraceae bacterium]|nr:aryl-sulfate sulfotransferase [Ilumatobacteraceae bacterium]
ATVTCAPQPTGGAATTPPLQSYTPINPVRLVDTRNNIGGVAAPIDRGCTMIVNVGADIPSGAPAVAFSMTAVNSEDDYFTVYPCAAGRPETSNLNARPGFATPNLVVAIPDANRDVCIFSHGRSDLIIDLSGWWSDGPNRFGSIAPQRVYDSRRPGFTALAPLRVREVQIPTSVIPAGSTAAVVNLTAANGVRPGFMTAFPCGEPAPNASNVNFLASEARAVGAIVKLGLGSTLCVIADTTVHVIVDVTGYYAPAPAFGPTAVVEPTAGRRVVDSRNGIGGPLLPLAAGEVRSFDPVAGLSNAADASAVMLNFVSTDAAGAGFLTAYPCGGAVPDVSTLNYVTGEAATNLATIELGADRQVCIVSSVRTNVIVDVFAVMTAPPGSPFERLSFDKPTWPQFNPEATDYVVECGAGTGSSNVAMSLDVLPFTSATVSVSGGPATPVGTGTINVAMSTDQLLTLATTRQGVGRNYHFRCVPPDFPRLDVTRPGTPTAGWYLTTSGFVSPNPATNGPFLIILDHHGAPVWYKRTPRPMMDAKRLSDGRLTFTPAYGPFGVDPDQGYWLTNLQGSPTVKHRTSDPSGLPTDHHDYIELPGGPNRRALISYPIVTAPGGLPFGGPHANKFSDGVIEEVNADGSQEWIWTMSDYFDPASSTFPINFETTPGFAGTGWDVFHINAIDRIDEDGDYLVTARHMDGVFRVNYATKNVLWTLGTPPARNPQPAGPVAPQLRIVGDPYGGPKRPHDARLNG